MEVKVNKMYRTCLKSTIALSFSPKIYAMFSNKMMENSRIEKNSMSS